ncbi:MAG TPA: ABC transporter permease [Firmicutes bacterium]|nr:ABC transporter permease [Bacillota bacterium]
MLNVNNRRCISRLSRRSIQNNRVRNIMAVAAIILTAVMFTTLFTIGTSIMDSFQLSTMRQVGTSAHAGFKFLTQEQYEIVKADPKVKDISYNILIGFGENPEFKKMSVEIRYTEEKNAEWGFTLPTTGTLPKNRLDIATSTKVLDMLGLPHELGVQVPLEFTAANGVKYHETFTLCGFWEQDAVSPVAEAFLSRTYSDEVAPVWQEPVSAEEGSWWMSGAVNPSFWFDSAWDIEGQVNALKERCGFGHEVNEGVNWAYASSEVDFSTIVLLTGILLLIMFSGYMIIYNIFYISVSKDIRFYGLLKTIGTTNRQLKKLVRRQALLLGLIGTPVGLVLGYLVSFFVVPIVMSITSIADEQVISVNPLIFIAGGLFTLITVWISCIRPCRLVSKVSPVDAVRYTENTGTGRKKAKKTKHVTPFSMAWDNIKRTPKKAVSVVISLSLSMILLNGTFTLVHSFDMDKFIENKAVSDFYITDASIVNLNTPTSIYNGVSKETQEEIRNLNGITDYGCVYMQEHLHNLSDTGLANTQKIIETYGETLPEMGKTEMLRLLNEEHALPSHLYGVDDFVAEKLELLDGTFDLEKFKTGNYVIVSSYLNTGEGRYYNIGDKVPIDFGNGNIREYEVMAIGDIPYALGPQHGHFLDIYITLPAAELIAQTGETGALNMAFNAQPSAISEIDAWLKNYCDHVNPDMAYQSRETFAAEFKNMQNMCLTVGALLSFILGLIGILNFINSVITSIQTRRQELAVLQAIGMTGQQLKQMLIGEGLWYTIMTVTTTLTIGSLITYGLITGITYQIWFFTYHFTITPVLFCIPVLIALSVIIPMLCYQNMCRYSVVDRLRESECMVTQNKGK